MRYDLIVCACATLICNAVIAAPIATMPETFIALDPPRIETALEKSAVVSKMAAQPDKTLQSAQLLPAVAKNNFMPLHIVRRVPSAMQMPRPLAMPAAASIKPAVPYAAKSAVPFALKPPVRAAASQEHAKQLLSIFADAD